MFTALTRLPETRHNRVAHLGGTPRFYPQRQIPLLTSWTRRKTLPWSSSRRVCTALRRVPETATRCLIGTRRFFLRLRGFAAGKPGKADFCTGWTLKPTDWCFLRKTRSRWISCWSNRPKATLSKSTPQFAENRNAVKRRPSPPVFLPPVFRGTTFLLRGASLLKVSFALLAPGENRYVRWRIRRLTIAEAKQRKTGAAFTAPKLPAFRRGTFAAAVPATVCGLR